MNVKSVLGRTKYAKNIVTFRIFRFVTDDKISYVINKSLFFHEILSQYV